jgi:hypothetical protein
MLRFVDNTYLQSVGACLSGQATSLKQVNTFLRFVGEIVIADSVLFTGDKEGPVFPVTERVFEDISRLLGTSTWLNYTAIDEKAFVSATYKAAAHLIEDIAYFDPNTTSHNLETTPKLVRSMADPQEELYSYLNSRRYSDMASRYAKPTTSNFAGFVLSREQVRNALADRLQRTPLTRGGAAVLATVVRMLAYDEFAKVHNATYLPSTGRSEMWFLPAKIAPLLLELLKVPAAVSPTQIDDRDTFNGIVRALITVSKGHPRDLLRLGWQLRHETSKIRNTFAHLHNRGDSLLLHSDDLLSEYQTIISQLMGKQPRPRLLNALLKSITFTIGMPTEQLALNSGVSDLPLREWLRYKIKHRHVHALAVLAKKAESLEDDTAYDQLIALSSGGVLSPR